MPTTKIVSIFERGLYWIARACATIVLIFCGVFIVGHLIGDAGAPTRSLVASDYYGMACFGVSLIGLLLAYKWETLGAIVAIGATAMLSLTHPQILFSLLAIIPVTGLLFLLHGVWVNAKKIRVHLPAA